MTLLIKAFLVFESSLLLLLALLSFEQTLRKGENSRLYLVAFLLVSALYLVSFGICYFAPPPLLSWAEGIKTPLVLSVIPFFFLFISAAVTGKVRPLKQVLYHLAPPVVFLIALPLIILLAYLNGNIFTSGIYMSIWTTVGHILLFLQTILYILMFFIKFRVYSRRLQEYYHKHPGSIIKLRNLLITFLGFFLLLDSWLMSFFLPELGFPIVYSLLMFVTACITGWLGLNLEIKKNNEEIEVSLEIVNDVVPEQVVLTANLEEGIVSQPVMELVQKIEVLEEKEQITERTEPEEKPKENQESAGGRSMNNKKRHYIKEC